jgi:hypothetical protein
VARSGGAAGVTRSEALPRRARCTAARTASAPAVSRGARAHDEATQPARRAALWLSVFCRYGRTVSRHTSLPSVLVAALPARRRTPCRARLPPRWRSLPRARATPPCARATFLLPARAPRRAPAPCPRAPRLAAPAATARGATGTPAAARFFLRCFLLSPLRWLQRSCYRTWGKASTRRATRSRRCLRLGRVRRWPPSQAAAFGVRAPLWL